MTQESQKLIVEIKGGMLWAVRALDNSDPQIEIILRDHDNIEAGDSDPLEGIDPKRIISIY